MGGISGVDGNVYAWAVNESGNLYIGVTHRRRKYGGKLHRRMERDELDGLGVGHGLGCVCAGGLGQRLVCRRLFFNRRCRPASNIAKWNGSSWSPLGSGMNGQVYALTVSGGNVYAAAHFESGRCDSERNCHVERDQLDGARFGNEWRGFCSGGFGQ